MQKAVLGLGIFDRCAHGLKLPQTSAPFLAGRAWGREVEGKEVGIVLGKNLGGPVSALLILLLIGTMTCDRH